MTIFLSFLVDVLIKFCIFLIDLLLFFEATAVLVILYSGLTDHCSRLAAFPVPGSAISYYRPPLSHAGIASLKLITSIVTLALHMWSNSDNARCHCPPFSHAEIAALKSVTFPGAGAGAGACAGARAGAGAGGTSHHSRLAAFPVPGATML